MDRADMKQALSGYLDVLFHQDSRLSAADFRNLISIMMQNKDKNTLKIYDPALLAGVWQITAVCG
ncbi:MAG: hypothetical protein ACLS5C_05730 [Waltera sp.]